MAYSVTYTKSISEISDPVYQPAPTALLLTATSVVSFLDLGVFVWIRDTVTGIYRFSNVATPKNLDDLDYFPDTPETADSEADFIRLRYMYKVYNVAQQADEAADEIEAILQRLCIDMDVLQVYASPVSITVSS